MKKSHNTRSVLLAVALLGLGLGACAGPDVRTETTKNFDLSKYQTYSWAPVHELEQPHQFSSKRDDLMDRQIKEEVNRSMAALGLHEVTNSPDVQVAYSVRVRNSVQVSPGFYPEPYYSYWDWNNPYLDNSRLTEKKTGSVVIDLLDSKTGNLVWRGIAVKDVGDTGPSNQDVQQSVAKILQDLPGATKVG